MKEKLILKFVKYLCTSDGNSEKNGINQFKVETSQIFSKYVQSEQK